MSTVLKNEEILTSKRISKLGLSEVQRSRALASLALAATLVGAFFATAKQLHLR
jgi:hypothetical protein